jgi:hypothetical protein
MEHPIARAPQFISFLLNVLPQMAKNIAVELGVHSLAFGGKFKVQHPSNVEKHDGHALSTLRLCLAFGLGDPEFFHCEDCCLVSGSPVDPTLVPSDDAAAKGPPL